MKCLQCILVVGRVFFRVWNCQCEFSLWWHFYLWIFSQMCAVMHPECVCQCKIDLMSSLQQTPSMRNIKLILLLLLSSSYLQLKRARIRDVFGWMNMFWFREAMNDVQTVFFCFTAFCWCSCQCLSFQFLMFGAFSICISSNVILNDIICAPLFKDLSKKILDIII